jgi:hypothetical protein
MPVVAAVVIRVAIFGLQRRAIADVMLHARAKTEPVDRTAGRLPRGERLLDIGIARLAI